MKHLLLALCSFVLLTSSCVSVKKFNAQVEKYDSLKKEHDKIDLLLSDCLSEKQKQGARVSSLEEEVASLKKTGGTMLQQLSDLSVVSAQQSESIRKSLENISSKDAYIKDLQVAMSRKDSLNMALVMNLKGALQDVDDQDVQIKVEGSAVLVSISDKMLFSSGSYDISPRAATVLGKVAKVLNAQPDVQFMVEGHTDNKKISTPAIKDNWDLSVLRATSVVRVLQKKYGVDPARIIAAGRGEFVSVADNATPDGRSLNRRTRIMILPQLDQFFKLLEPKQ